MTSTTAQQPDLVRFVFITHQLDLGLRRGRFSASHDQTAALADRLDKLEKQVAVLAAPPPPAATATTEAPSAAEVGDTSGGGDAKAAYVQARQLMLNGDYPAAAAAFQGFIDTYGSSPSIPAAHYWLGEVNSALKWDYPGAVTHFISAIHGWPQTAWAPDAVIKLSLALIELHKIFDACGAPNEFKRHYPHATAAAKARAAEPVQRQGGVLGIGRVEVGRRFSDVLPSAAGAPPSRRSASLHAAPPPPYRFAHGAGEKVCALAFSSHAGEAQRGPKRRSPLWRNGQRTARDALDGAKRRRGQAPADRFTPNPTLF